MTNEPSIILTAIDGGITLLIVACVLILLGVMAQVVWQAWKQNKGDK